MNNLEASGGRYEKTELVFDALYTAKALATSLRMQLQAVANTLQAGIFHHTTGPSGTWTFYRGVLSY
jgi:1-aminocyclopropane-1-carboxylate deaminase/D-cysteine desulfhydrase-like pyridoxal-dependent ACC family enzyme